MLISNRRNLKRYGAKVWYGSRGTRIDAASPTSFVVAVIWYWWQRWPAINAWKPPVATVCPRSRIVKAPWKDYAWSTEGVCLLTSNKVILYATPSDGYHHVALHRHRGVYP